MNTKSKKIIFNMPKAEKKAVNKAVKKIAKDYGEALKKLSKT